MMRPVAPDALPLTQAQTGVWIAQRLDPENPIYTIAEFVDISGEIDATAFEHALRRVVTEADALRVRIEESDDTTYQVVRSEVAWTMPVVDLRADAEPYARAVDWMRRAQRTPLDPGSGVPFEFALLLLGQDRTIWFQRYHHAVMDGLGMTLVERRVASVYSELVTGTPAGEDTALAPLSTLIDADVDYRAGTAFTTDEQYWSSELAGAPDPVTLGSGRPSMPERLERRTVHLSPDEVAGIRALAREAEISWPSVLVAALGTYLSRLTGVDDVVLGMPVAARPGRSTRDVPGMTSNIVPLRLRLPVTQSVGELLTHTARQLRDAVRHQRYRYEDLRRDRKLITDDARLIGPHVNMVLGDYPLDFAGAPATVTNLAGGPVDDLSLVVDARCADGGVDLVLDVNPNLYDRESFARLTDRFVGLVRTLSAGAPSDPVASLAMATDSERELVLSTWNDTATSTPELTLVALLEAQAAVTPNAVAVVSGRTELTYRELHGRAEKLARVLVAHGVGPETFVAVCLPRTENLMVALLAVLKAGGAYLPVDPGYPADRIALMIDDARPVLGLASDEVADLLPETETPWLDMDEVAVTTAAEAAAGPLSDAERLAPLSREHAAYVIYTSGSTGRPKGVVISHAAVADLMHWADTDFGATRLGKVLAATSLNFDVSVFEMFGPLCCGGSIELVRDLLALAERPEGWSGTLLSGVPSALAQLLTHGEARVHADDVVLAGEGLSLPVSRQIQAAIPGGRLANIYGPTEATVYSTAWYADGPVRSAPPIGKPITNTRTYVLDSALRPVPPGATGELYLGGTGLARGYLNRHALTAERFVADPYGEPGARMYRTGDVVRWTTDGDIEYLGRADDQVKVRGFRIELSEIETVLARRDELAQVAVVVREDQPDVRQLVAYLVPTDDSIVDSEVLRRHVAASLPEYMVPAAFVTLDRLPLNPNGKLDRKALPAPEYVSAGTGREAATENERLLCGLFESVLGVREVTAEDSFFDLGGDSIVAIQLVSKARRAGLSLTPRQVFTAKTPAELATLATTEAQRAADDATPEVDPVGDVALLPIAYWLRDRGGPVDSVHQAVVVNTPAGATAAEIARALQSLLDHHDALRLRLLPEWRATIAPSGGVAVDRVLRHVEISDDTALPSVVEEQHAAAWRELSLTDDVLMRAVWVDAGTARPGRLLLVAHHLVVDGVSWRILIDDLARAWRGEELLPVGTSLRAFATALRTVDRSAELPRWLDQLTVPDPDLGSRAFDPVLDTAGTALEHTLTLPVEQSAAVLRSVPAVFLTGAREVLLTALALGVEHWRSSRGSTAGGLRVDVEGHGREELVPGADLSRTVGWFTSLFPLGIDLTGIDVEDALAGGPAAGAALKRVKQALAELPDNGAGFGPLRYLDDRGAALAEHRPPQIGFNYLGRLDVGDTEWGLADQIPVPALDPAARLAHAVEINAFATADDRLVATVTAAGELLPEDEVTALIDAWRAAMAGLADHAASIDGFAGHTPSDFPLVTLDQDAVTALESEYGTRIDVLPVTPLQRGLRFHALFDIDGPDVYTVQFTFDLSGSVDTARLRSAMRELTRRYPNLLAAFPRPEVQVVPTGDLPEVPLTEIDLSSAVDRDGELARVLADDRTARFDLTRPPLLRMTLVRVSDERTVLAVTNHHILLDGWSMPIIAQELFALYGDEHAELPPAAAYSDYLGWLVERDRGEAERVWAEELAGIEEPTLLVPGGRSPHAQPPERVVTNVDADDFAALTELARHHGVTLNTVVQGAWGVLLGTLTGGTDVCFGATVSGRPADLAGVESMVGLFINTVPVRFRAGHDESVADVLVRLQSRQAALMGYQHLGLADIQRTTGLEELFDTLTVFENYPLDPDGLRTEGTGLGVTDIGGTDATHYPLTLVITGGDVLELRLDYQPDLVSRADADLILRRLRRVLTAFAADAHAPIGSIDVLSPEEQHRVLRRFNDTAYPVTPTTLPAIFAEQVARTPDNHAVVFAGRSLTYLELDAEANRLARYLLARGVGPGRLVALAVPRSLDLLVAMYAIHKAGGAYLPIDPDYPADRIAFMLTDAAPTLLITTADTDLPATDVPTILVGDAGPDLGEVSPAPVTDADRPEPLTPGHPAYVIYTSGSTGLPKGVLVPHSGIVNRLRWMQRTYLLDESDRVLQKTPSGFDVSVWEFFWPLQTGATLVVAKPEGHKDPVYLAELIDTERVTTVHFVPSMLHAFLESLPEGSGAGLRRVVCSGEALPADLAHRLLSAVDTELHNLYGPTEASVDVTYWECSPDDPSVPIGHPVWNTRMYVLDGGLRPAPVGVTGELYIAGDQLASGYLNRPELTAQRFVADPYGAPGDRMYRTGDIARWRDDGALEYLGRVDDQVKIRGQRIELGEIEAVLTEHEDVSAVAVIAREDAPGTKRLVAYPVGAADPDALREFATARLPEHMVPSAFVPMPDLPLTPNGKLDRKALPAPDFGAMAASGRAADTPVERTLAELFAEVLGIPEVGADDSFFDLGGDSIMSIQLVSRAKQAGIGIRPRDVFQRRTVAELAAVATPLDAETTPVTEAEGAGSGELTPVPVAHWLLDDGGDIAGFHQSMVLTTPPGLTAGSLTTMITTLVDHHDALRLRVHRDGTAWRTEITPRGTVSATGLLTRIDASALASEDVPRRLADLAESARDQLDPESGHVARFVWLDGGDEHPGRLLIVLHHLVVDGVSWRILTEDLTRLGRGESPLPVGTSYRSWGAVLVDEARARAGELPLWVEQVSEAAGQLGSRPLDPDVDTAATAESVTVEVPPADTEAVLTDLPAAYNAGAQDVLLTALALAVVDWRGVTEPTVIDVEGHGRADLPGTDTSRTVGWFTTSYPVRLTPLRQGEQPRAALSGGKLTGTALKRVKEQLRALPDDGLGYGLLRYLNPETAPSLAGHPRPQLGFNYLGRIPASDGLTAWAPAEENVGIGGGAGSGMRLPHVVEITAITQDSADGPRLSATWTYPAGVLTEQQVLDLADRWRAALAALAEHARRGEGGGLTPSDLKLVSLSQEDIESFEDELAGELDLIPNTDWEMLR